MVQSKTGEHFREKRDSHGPLRVNWTEQYKRANQRTNVERGSRGGPNLCSNLSGNEKQLHQCFNLRATAKGGKSVRKHWKHSPKENAGNEERKIYHARLKDYRGCRKKSRNAALLNRERSQHCDNGKESNRKFISKKKKPGFMKRLPGPIGF